jgi:hypothetical protein
VKKVLLFLLTMVYMTVSSGIAMEIHYCMGEKTGVDFYQVSDKKCGKCGMKEQDKNGCCNDEHQFFKLEDSHKKSVADYSFQIGETCTVPNYPTFDWQLVSYAAIAQPVGHSPPPYIEIPARILHGVFRL